MIRFWFGLFLCGLTALISEEPSVSPSRSTLFASLNPTSIAEHLAFYELYPNTQEGHQALAHVWQLFGRSSNDHIENLAYEIDPMLPWMNHSSSFPLLSFKQIQIIQNIAKHLENRRLLGHDIWDPEQILLLENENIDLAHALFVSEMSKDSPEERQRVLSYESQIDLIALQILARLSPNASNEEKIRMINDFIFSEMRFRFPPHSLYAKNIDIYTQLPSVLDSRRGVCLGVSILYLSIAERIGLPLEIITPPGHIYIRYRNTVTNEIINIETTARGIDVPTESYLGIETRQLQKRTIREVIGLSYMNQASVDWQNKNFDNAIHLYEKARQYLPDDDLVKRFLAYSYLFAGKTKEGKNLLMSVRNKTSDYFIVPDTIADDYLSKKVDESGILVIYTEVDDKHASILEKQTQLQAVVSQFPLFRQGLLHLALTYLQLNREKEAIPLLERYLLLQPNDPTVHYYLSVIYLDRFFFNASWKHLLEAEQIVALSNHTPLALKRLRHDLESHCPKPVIQ